MKKLITLLLVLLMTASTAVAAPDLSGYSLAELLELRSLINDELHDRGAVITFRAPVGVYTVGVDFPAGTYTIECGGTYGCMIKVKNPGERLPVFSETAYTDGQPIGKVEMKNGQTVEVLVESAVFTTYTGLTITVLR